MLVAETGESLAGFIVVHRDAKPFPEMRWLIVLPEFHGTGLAQRLLQAALRRVGNDTPVMLGVVHFNRRAIAFYEKCGFRIAGPVDEGYRIPRLRMIRPSTGTNQEL